MSRSQALQAVYKARRRRSCLHANLLANTEEVSLAEHRTRLAISGWTTPTDRSAAQIVHTFLRGTFRISMGKITKSGRSRIMQSIRSKHTRPELYVRAALRQAGMRYRLHVRDLPGTPDIANKRTKIAVQVRGCFLASAWLRAQFSAQKQYRILGPKTGKNEGSRQNK